MAGACGPPSNHQPSPVARAARQTSACGYWGATHSRSMTTQRLQPAQLLGLAALEGGDVGIVAEREGDLVEPLEQALLAESIDFEAVHVARGRGQFLAIEIDGQVRARLLRKLGPQAGRLLGRQRDRQQSVLEAIVEEDVAEARPDHGAEAVIPQRIDRVLARGAAADVLFGDQDARAAPGRLIQDKTALLRARIVEPQIVEQKAAVTGIPRLAQEPRGEDRKSVV